MMRVVVIPALQPDNRLVSYARSLLARGFARVVVVDDGSGPEGGNPELTAEQSTANADELLAYIRRVPGLTNENRAALIVQAINNGRISESDAQRIASILGIDV